MNGKRENSETRYRIIQAMLELGRTVPVGEITVRAICSASQVSRKTFYNYFSGKYDLIQEIYRDRLARSNLDVSGTDADIRDWQRAFLWDWVSFFQENRNFLCGTYATDQWNILENIFYQQSVENAMEDVARYLGVPVEELSPRIRRLVRFYSGGMMSYLLEWMLRGCREPREEIVETFLEAAPYRQLWQRRKELREARAHEEEIQERPWGSIWDERERTPRKNEVLAGGEPE